MRLNQLRFSEKLLLEVSAILALSRMPDDLFNTSEDSLYKYFQTLKGFERTEVKALVPFHNGDARLKEFYELLEDLPLKGYFEDGLLAYYGEDAKNIFDFE